MGALLYTLAINPLQWLVQRAPAATGARHAGRARTRTGRLACYWYVT